MIKSIEELPIEGKRVLMRVDFNVPLKHHEDRTTVADDTRIREALPTIQYALEKGAKLILASHLGRPKGPDPKFSLLPIAKHLSKLIDEDVMLTDDCVGDGVEMLIKNMKSRVFLLENVRFHSEEEQNSPEFAKALASLGEVYINDAFGTAHRKHASTFGVAELAPIKGCGLLVKKELDFLSKLLDKPEKPFVAILGGSKVSDKIRTIENLFLQADSLLIGGVMAHAFRLAQDKNFKLPENAKTPKQNEVIHAGTLLQKAKNYDVELLLPVDDNNSFDIGPKTIDLFVNAIKGAKTVFWNGPVGMFENPKYAAGSTAIANAIAESNATSVVGGGDTVAAINVAGVTEKISHISTGGGATLKYLEGNSLPGLKVLEIYDNQTRTSKHDFED